MAAKAGGDAGESFESRVKRLFGSRLLDSVPNSAFSGANLTWSVAAGEVERHRWDRPSDLDREEDAAAADAPCSSAFYDAGGCLFKNNKERRRRKAIEDFEGNLGDLDDLDEEEEAEEEAGEKDVEEEIRGSIGLDPTLDREEEEDSFDREALGSVSYEDRVYMKQVMDDGPYLNIHTVVPELFDQSETYGFQRDARADHTAAFARLHGDDTSVRKTASPAAKVEQEASVVLPGRMSEDEINVKPILKRKNDHDDQKQKKRVRFTNEGVALPGSNDAHSLVADAMDTNTAAVQNASLSSQNPGVPDYVKNPSKYTCYSMETTDCDEEGNKRAFSDFFDLVRKRDSAQMQPEDPVEHHGSITFIPRKKLMDDAMSVDGDSGSVKEDSSKGTPQYMGVVAGGSDEVEADVAEMDQDDDKMSAQQGALSSKKAARRYRSSTFDE